MKLPHAIDSSMISTFRSCPQSFLLRYVENWAATGNSVHLHAGGAYASALELSRRAYYEQGKSLEEAEAIGMYELITKYGQFEAPEGSAKTLARMMGALEFYYSEYPFDEDSAQPIHLPSQKRGIEFTFAIPLPILHPDTGNPILYCGRTDMLVDFAGGCYVLDDKTTTSLGAQWSKQWTLRSQFTGYAWACKQVGIEVQGAIVRGLSILKTKYDTQQIITPRSQFLIDRWYAQLLKDLERMVKMYKEYKATKDNSSFDFNLDHACTEFGSCAFVRVCESPEPENWLEGYFQRIEWLPLERIAKKED
jgi:hypothetical protein